MQIEYSKFGAIIFKGPDNGVSPGVAVFTTEGNSIDDSPKRSVHFSSNDDFLIIQDFGVDNYCKVNSAKEYIQLSENYANELRKNGIVYVPHNKYNIFRAVKN